MKPFARRIANPLAAGCLAGMSVATSLAGQVRAPEASPGPPIVLQAADGTSLTLSPEALLVEGDPCLPLGDLAMALHGTRELAPSLALSGSTLTALELREPKGVLGVGRSGVISTRLRGMQEPGGEHLTCVPVTDLARAMGGIWNGASIEGFDSQIESMMANNILFLAVQTKVQNVSQTTQLISNVAKADHDAKMNAIRNMRASLFEETETALALVTPEQAAWARSFATTRGYGAGRAEIEAAIGATFPHASDREKIRIHMILLQILMGDVIGAMRGYAILMEEDMRQFSRMIVKKLDEVQKARSTIIRTFARTKPPRAYAGQDPQAAARAQDRSQRYTQFVQMSTQLMNELQNTERELVDALQTMQRDLDDLWQAYASLRDEEFRRTAAEP